MFKILMITLSATALVIYIIGLMYYTFYYSPQQEKVNELIKQGKARSKGRRK